MIQTVGIKDIKRTWIYDIEVFPNFLGFVFIDRISDEKREFIIHNDINELDKLVTFISTECAYLSGYNSSKYDNIIINFLIAKQNKLKYMTTLAVTNEAYELSKAIIHDGISVYFNPKTKPYIWTKLYKTVDLMSLMAFDKNRVSLKQVGIAMRWKKIQDLPKPFDKFIQDDEVDLVMKYCVNDVEMTKELSNIVISEIGIRKDVGNMYGLNLWSASRSAMSEKLISSFWTKETGLEFKEFRKLRTTYDAISLSECISDKVIFKTKALQDLLIRIKSTILKPGDKFKETIIIGESRYDMLLGGLHSHNKAMIVEESDDILLKDADFGSYYPNLMINENAYPAHLSDKFLVLFKKLVTQRLDAKAKGDKIVANALKIVINSAYGKLLFEHSWLYDAKAGYTVTLNGQLYLLMIIEELELAGCSVYYANTDGFMTKVHKDQEKTYMEICMKFEKYVDIPLEFEDYTKCVIRDVNNFTMITKSGDIKEKGAFLRDVDRISTFLRSNYTCSYDMPIISLALYEYFVNSKPIKDTITNHKDIYDFCKAQKIGSQYIAEYHKLSEDKLRLDITICQKTNRYYVSKGQGKFYKRKKKEDTLSDLSAGYNVEIFNDYYESDDYNINYHYYIRVTQKIIDIMEPKQLTLF